MKLFWPSTFVAAIISGLAAVLLRNKVNFILMKFFRNLSRHKARRRLYGNDAALIPLLFGNEEPINIDFEASSKEEDLLCGGFTMTVEELAQMDGSTETTPIYLAVKGQIYDVSAARNLYGPGKSYHSFVGKDSSRGFATGCLEPSCMVATLDGLSEEQIQEVHRWAELYHTHDKYKCVGKLVNDFIEEVVERDIARSSQADEDVSGQKNEEESEITPNST